MKKLFSKHWKASKKPRKQRKYLANAPLHVRKRFLSSILCKDLREKYSKRNIPLKKGDKVKIMRGNFKKKTGKINKINTKERKIYIDGIETVKKDGTKVFPPINPSNLMILELDLDDKKRRKILERK